jgi:hypothetical protein
LIQLKEVDLDLEFRKRLRTNKMKRSRMHLLRTKEYYRY